MPDLVAAEKPVVLIYADPLLTPSATFVRSQGMALKTFSPVFVGPRLLTGGLKLPHDRVIAMHECGFRAGPLSKLREVPFKVFGYDPLFFRRARDSKPVLLHAHFGPAALTALPLARWLKVPLVATFHGYDVTVSDNEARKSSCYSYREYVRRRKELEGGASLLIAVSNFIRGEAVKQGFSPDKIVVHYIGVDTEVFRPHTCVKREPIVLFVGRLAEKKGCKYAIQAMSKVQASFPEVELIIIGDGPQKLELENLARQILRRFRFLGFQPPDVVRQWMNRARIFAAPSLRAQSGDADGYPIAFAEAQAMGLPVVSFAYGGILEAVADKETGFLVPERDSEGLALCLRLLLEDEALCARMSEAARRRVCAEFDLRAQAERLEGLYSQVLEKTAAEPSGKRLLWTQRA